MSVFLPIIRFIRLLPLMLLLLLHLSHICYWLLPTQTDRQYRQTNSPIYVHTYKTQIKGCEHFACGSFNPHSHTSGRSYSIQLLLFFFFFLSFFLAFPSVCLSFFLSSIPSFFLFPSFFHCSTCCPIHVLLLRKPLCLKAPLGREESEKNKA